MRRLFPVLLGVLAAGLLAASPASADFGFRELDLAISGTEAGVHPDEVTTRVDMETRVEEVETGPGKFKVLEVPDGHLRNLVVDMPAGFAGNPGAVPECDPALFITLKEGHPECPNSTAVGYAAVKVDFNPVEFGAPAYLHVAVYNLPASPGYAAKLGFSAKGVPVTLDVGVREGPPYNVYARLTNASEVALFYASKVTLWGNPANEDHDPLRGDCLESENQSEIDDPISEGDCPAGLDELAFLTAPRSCEESLTASFAGLAWNTGEVDVGTASAPARDECQDLKFDADTAAAPTATTTESPTGLTFDLNIDDPGLADPDEKAFSDVKATKVILPPGVTFNPAQAEGLGVCTEEQLGRETSTSEFGDGCPAASKVGEVEVETPLLEGHVVNGTLFVAEPYKNPFDSLIALYMVIQDRDLGISVKLPARVDPDPVTGQVTTTFGDPSSKVPGFRTLPQLPLGQVRVSLPGGPRSPLVTPPRCGTYETKAIFTPWANPATTFTSTSTFQILSGPGGAPCPVEDPFSPGFTAGTVDNAAGAYSPFLVRLTRSDGEAEITRFDSILPPGVVGKIAGLAHCSDAAIAAAAGKSGGEELAFPSCPAGSEVGHVIAGSGVGSELTYVKGNVYLAGPFGGAPLSVVAIVPAVAGPFDVGTVVTREALDLDPTTAEVRVDGASSDPIPTILQGVPLKLRDLRIDVDRPGFTLNPTSCDPEQARATLFSHARSVALSHRFQASGCGNLGFKPKLSLKLKGGTRRGKHPSLRSVLTPRPGDANIAGATVLLPRSQQIDNAHINNPCTRVQFNADACPEGSVLGTAKAWTPLLDQPLEGPVYFRSNGGERELPDIVADLHGQFRIILVGFVDSRNARLRTRFLGVPDAPVSKFLLNLKGGKAGLLVNNRNICAGSQHVKLSLLGQNGKRHDTEPRVKTSCKKKSSGRKSGGRKR